MAVSTSLTAALFVRNGAERFIPTIRSLRAASPGLRIVVCHAYGLDRGAFEGLDVEEVSFPTLAGFANNLLSTTPTHVLIVEEAVLFPPAFELTTMAALEDARVATVSYWCNRAGSLSFPYRDGPAPHLGEDLDEATVT